MEKPSRLLVASAVLRAVGVLLRGVGSCADAGAEALEFSGQVVGKAWSGVRESAAGIKTLMEQIGGKPDEPQEPAQAEAPAPAAPAAASTEADA